MNTHISVIDFFKKSSFRILTILFLSNFWLSFCINAQTGNIRSTVEENVNTLFTTNSAYMEVANLFALTTNNSQIQQFNHLKEFSILDHNQLTLISILSNKPDLLKLEIPVDNSNSIILKLVRYELYESAEPIGLGKSIQNHVAGGTLEGLHYRGIIEGSSKNWAAISLFENNITGLIATLEGNYNLGKIKNMEKYIIYNDADLINEKPTFSCGNIDLNETLEKSNYQSKDNIYSNPLHNSTYNLSCPIKLYWVFDIDFAIIAGYPNNPNWLNNANNNRDALFNQIQLVYQQESIPISLNYYWIYGGNPLWYSGSLINTFLAFGNQMHNGFDNPSFNQSPNSDMAMFIDVYNTATGEGYAVINGMCSNYSTNGGINGGNGGAAGQPTGNYGYSRIQNYFYQYPTFSATVLTIAHEMGHTLGSRHTHWCGWPGGPIDGCVSPEPDYSGVGCSPGPLPGPDYSSIMSYCANQYGFINLAYGFGNLPGNVIRNRYQQTISCRCGTGSINEDNISSMDIHVSPNPASNEIVISGLNETLFEYKINIFNASGILESKHINHDNQIDIRHLENGIYFLEVILSEKKSIWLKFIKVKN